LPLRLREWNPSAGSGALPAEAAGELSATSAERDRTASFRRVLAGPMLALVGVVPALAAGLWLSFGLDPGDWSSGQWANVLAFASAYVVAWALVRRFATLTNSSMVALWSIASTGAIVVAFFFATRAYYSLTFLGTAFLVGAAWLVAARHLRSRAIAPILAVVPGGHVEIVESLAGVRCVALRRPAIRWLRVDGLVADLHARHDDEWARFVVDERLRGRPVYHCADVYERFAQKVSIVHLREGDLEELNPPPYATFKRVIDFVGALAGLVLASPLLLAAAIAIKLEDGGPILFTQERVGWRDRTFRMLKLRSMRTDAEKDGPQLANEDDDRATRVGRVLRRFRIDELPQLVNVLRGEMSVIGPRPEQIPFVEHFKQELPFFGSRHLVKPGITGWAQIRWGYASDLPEVQQKLVHDLYYVKHMSLWLDAYIVGRTVWIVATGFGAR
jgi:lipopolysaccharide/colanic/teichoic acid biosynthesis glycosyltransferase